MAQNSNSSRPSTPHGASLRGLESTPSAHVFSGRFGRMFRTLPSYDVKDESLVELGKAMIQDLEDGQLDKALGEEDDDENTSLRNGELRLPAGYTYFGQFVDHDITFDPVSSLSRQDDPEALVDFRTPRFDLDSLYGRGPADQPYLYDADGMHLLLGREVSTDPSFAGPDLQRVATGRAIIGDPRNDENLIVSQLQVAMIRFHNRVVDLVLSEHSDWSSDDVFKRAQQQVRWHYQWVVVHDFLPRLVGDDVVDEILAPEGYLTSPSTHGLQRSPHLRFYHWREQPYMPLEFSVAAYRYGHSVVRPSYLINDVAKADPSVVNAKRIPLFSQTDIPKASLNGFRPLVEEWGVQWKYFLAGVNGHDPAAEPNLPQPSYKLDAQLSHPLGALHHSTAAPEVIAAGFRPEIAQSLAVRNLLRGKRLSLPCGQDVARAMGLEPLSDDELFSGIAVDDGVKQDLAGRAPLWFYCLKEAEILSDAAQLGPVAGRIVAEVLIGLLCGDPMSFQSIDPNWTPTLPSAASGSFTLADIVNLAIPAETTAPGPYGS